MRIGIVGGGPAGLYFALLMKRLDSTHEIRVVEQNQIVDGIESVRPLPVRTQYLFHQAEVLNRQTQLVRGGS